MKNSKVTISVVGATGYTGAELVRLLMKHPRVQIQVLTSESFAGQKISEVYPEVRCDIVCMPLNVDKIKSSLVFTALPHAKSAEVAGHLIDRGSKVIDFSADFRLEDVAVYQEWYGVSHPRADLLSKAVYGLPEIYRQQIKQAMLVANPGCYPTSVILALAPLLKGGHIKLQGLVVDSKSGVSGAGRTLSLATHFPEVNENMNAYSVAGHRHLPEIEQELTKIANKNVSVTFVAHLIPVNRGILSTCYVELAEKVSTKMVQDMYAKFYENEPFVEILAPGLFPNTRDVLWSNRCRIGLHVAKNDRLIVISAIDNLLKGASGQAIQNMNLMCGFAEDLALA